MKWKTAFLSALLVTSSFYATPAGLFEQQAAQAAPGKSGAAFDQKVIARIDEERMYEDVYHLTETIGPRVAGTEAEKETADFLEQRLESYGYEVEVQEFSIPDLVIGHLHTESGDEVLINIPSGSAATAEEGLTAQLYDAGLGYPADYNAEAAGKIALIQRGGFTFAEKVQNAEAAGAAGVLIYNNVDQAGPLNPSLGGNEMDIPVGGITKASGEALKADVLAANGTVTLTVQAFEGATSENIIATRTPKKGGGDGIVHVSAHYDSVPFAAGASDNASGTAVALEIARVLKSYPIDEELRFVFVGAEEIGLLGSRHYVSELTESEVARSTGNFNMDMVGTSWDNATAIYMNTLDGQANIVTETAKATGERIGTPSELILYQRGSSDHVSFYEAGIPAVNFIRREPGTASLEPYYHTPLDTIEFISAERLKEAGDLVGASVYQLIRK
ncbi:aminopeptidase [Planococcus plakortidis]|uniref:Aminopeptidase n=1 Tax=Planococcus plakortidis TaxID=1038856 RepID=A0A1C7ECN8_9BACL|nr:M20/M25/M40 family metallo-hydrolase [Planococcus plakortidis]ANU21734.1 aminopeptidase [Planococcus plakortidis]